MVIMMTRAAETGFGIFVMSTVGSIRLLIVSNLLGVERVRGICLDNYRGCIRVRVRVRLCKCVRGSLESILGMENIFCYCISRLIVRLLFLHWTSGLTITARRCADRF